MNLKKKKKLKICRLQRQKYPDIKGKLQKIVFLCSLCVSGVPHVLRVPCVPRSPYEPRVPCVHRVPRVPRVPRVLRVAHVLRVPCVFRVLCVPRVFRLLCVPRVHRVPRVDMGMKNPSCKINSINSTQQMVYKNVQFDFREKCFS